MSHVLLCAGVEVITECHVLPCVGVEVITECHMFYLVQVWKSSLSVRWQISDPESSVVEQFVSLTTRDSIHHNVPAVKVRCVICYTVSLCECRMTLVELAFVQTVVRIMHLRRGYVAVK